MLMLHLKGIKIYLAKKIIKCRKMSFVSNYTTACVCIYYIQNVSLKVQNNDCLLC